MSVKLSTEEFIKRAKETHGERYDYTRVHYSSSKSKVEIGCSTHGFFHQLPFDHIRGYGCNECGAESSSKKQKSNSDEFIAKARQLHGSKYRYDKVSYVTARKNVVITCPSHGDFEQTPCNHLKNRGCPKCKHEKTGNLKRYTTQGFIEKAEAIHRSTYDYSMVNYSKSQEKVNIICKKHGLFEQAPSAHLAGLGCAKCGRDTVAVQFSLTADEFAKRSSAVHKNKFDYSKVNYVNANTKVTIICPDHGEFDQIPSSHLDGCGCPKCTGRQSRPETEIIDLITSLGLQVVHGDRSVIKPLEIDILVPEAKLAIEFNGNYWHSDKQKPKSYHFDKTKAANEAGYRMIHVWEGDWDARKDQIKRIIINACGKTNEKPLNARDCTVQEIEMKVVNEFLDNNHIQGRVHQAKIRLGLVHKTEGLVAVMTFGKGANIRGNARVNAEATSEVPWNLTRYAAKHSVRGGASKLFKAAVTRYELTFVESYSMNDYFTGGMYEQLGFGRTVAYGADYRVYHPKTGMKFKYHWQRRNIPNVLRDIGRCDIVFNPDKSIDPRTEFEIEDLAGAMRLWDSGKTKWTWRATL